MKRPIKQTPIVNIHLIAKRGLTVMHIDRRDESLRYGKMRAYDLNNRQLQRVLSALNNIKCSVICYPDGYSIYTSFDFPENYVIMLK